MDSSISSSRSNSHRKLSAFLETGLGGEDAIIDDKLRQHRPRVQVRFRSHVSIIEPTQTDIDDRTEPTARPVKAYSSLASLAAKLPAMAVFLAVALFLQLLLTPLSVSSSAPIVVEAGVVAPEAKRTQFERRQDTSTDVCKRWGGQSALVNGTLYYYGGHATSSPDQNSDTWSELHRNPF